MEAGRAGRYTRSASRGVYRSSPPDGKGTVLAVSPSSQVTQFAVAVERGGHATAGDEAPLELHDAWTPEHLVLLALARCSLASLHHHAGRLSLEVSAGAEASGTIGKRGDGSWGFLEIDCRLVADVTPAPDGESLSVLVTRAERGCFVGGSLEPRPHYTWSINAEELS